MTFLQNKYTKWYWSIISHAQTRVIFGYHEKHHIIPKSLGGSNSADNLVRLTAREHFICHILLTKMTEGKAKRSMIFAANATAYCRKSRETVCSSYMYKNLKEQLSALRRGIPRSAETKQKLSTAHQGKTLSKEHRDAIGAGIKKRYSVIPVSQETRKKIGDLHRGKIYGSETKRKIGEASKGRKEQSKLWRVKDPCGNIFETDRLEQFCEERGLSYIALRRSYGFNPVYRGATKGWQAIYRSR